MSLRRVTARLSIMFFIALGLALSSAQTIQVRPRRKPPDSQNNASAQKTPPSPGNWSQVAKFISGKGLNAYPFPASVAISGDTVVAGADTDYVNSAGAFVFEKTARGWANTLPAAALNLPGPSDRFGSTLAIDGDTVVVGAPSFYAGSPSYVYVFVKPPTGWVDMLPTAVLTPSDSIDGYFGQSVAISGNTIVVGDDGYNSNAGSGYVFVKPASGWTDMTETAKLTASDGVLSDDLGYSAAISGSTIVLGAPQNFVSIGKAYIFVEPAGGWTTMTQTAELTVPGGQDDAQIGASVAISGGTVIAGAPQIGGKYAAAYVFERPPSGWADTHASATFSPGDVQQQSNFFGSAVGISGNIAIVGAFDRSYGNMLEAGGVYVFEKPSGGWKNASSTTVLTASDMRWIAWLGSSVGIDGKEVVAGAPNGLYAGAAFIYQLP